MASKKIVLNAAGDAATVTAATVGDIFTTAISGNEFVSGAYKLVQMVGAAAIGAGVQNYRLTGSWNFLPGR